MGIVFIMFAELWVTFFSDMYEIMGLNFFNQNGTSRLCAPFSKLLNEKDEIEAYVFKPDWKLCFLYWQVHMPDCATALLKSCTFKKFVLLLM